MVQRHLVGLQIGPIQGFIATARRTRDLWFGSFVLSEISKAAARHLHAAGCRLVFPCPLDPRELEPGSDLNVSNHVLAIADTDLQGARAAVQGAESAVRGSWNGFAEDVLRWIKEQGHRDGGPGPVVPARWQQQRDDVVETYGAVVPFRAGGYRDALHRLNALLAARKQTREFRWHEGEAGVPKSALDAARETVLATDLSTRQQRRLGLTSRNDHLDCPGLVKRVGGTMTWPDARRSGLRQFTPVSRIAADDWLCEVAGKAPDRLGQLQDAHEKLVRLGLCSKVRGNEGCYGEFGFDAELLHAGRREALRDELGADPEAGAAHELLDHLDAILKPLGEEFGRPGTYVALLQADGDNIGELIDSAASDRDDPQGRHEDITRALVDFAARVPGIVRKHRGHCIYCGGDDVLALLPVRSCLVAADELRREFSGALEHFSAKLHHKKPPTLSVGIAVRHMLDSLGRLRNDAREAQGHAKDPGPGDPARAPRNALAIRISPRSGSTLDLRVPWHGTGAENLQCWMEAFASGALPGTAPYELRRILRSLSWCVPSVAGRQSLERASVGRGLQRRRERGGEAPISKEMIERLEGRVVEVGLERTVNELAVARWLSMRASGFA